jgi:hypothetical protein
MAGNALQSVVILPVSTPVYVTLSADDGGLISLGIRIDGTNELALARGVSVPEPGRPPQTYTTTLDQIV